MAIPIRFVIEFYSIFLSALTIREENASVMSYYNKSHITVSFKGLPLHILRRAALENL